MKFKEFVIDFAAKAKNYIGYYEEFKELTGEEKKLRVDKKMADFALNILKNASLNVFLKFIIKNYIIKNIPAITQAIFDLIKAQIKGITEKI